MTHASVLKQKIEETLSKEMAANTTLVKMLNILYDIKTDIEAMGFDIPPLAPRIDQAIDSLTTIDDILDEVVEQLRGIYDRL